MSNLKNSNNSGDLDNIKYMNLEKLEKMFIGTYCDIRFGFGETNHIILKDGNVDEISSGINAEVSVRVLYKNGWGYATSNNVNINEIEKLMKNAYKIAKISNENSKKTVILKDVETFVDYVKPNIKMNPKNIDIDEKKEYLALAHEYMIDNNINNSDSANSANDVINNINNGKIVSTSVAYSDGSGYSMFINSEGTRIEKEKTKVLMYMTVVAKGETLQYASERIGGDGFEVITNGDIPKKAEDAKNRVLRLLNAKPCPKGEFNVILDPELAGVFIHEAVGHASEADLVLQNDSVFNGKIGEIVGSEYVNVIDDPLIEGSFGYYKYDSEGVKGRKTTIIEEGILKSYLHTRETAGRLNMDVTGNARSQGLDKPLVRMSNTYIKPGDWKFDELLEDTKNGIYLKGSRGGQVDTGKGLFQFNAVEAFSIENGELTTPLRDAGLSGEILTILHNINAVSNEFKLSVGYCGKNGQSVPVGDGGGSIRTRTILC